MHYLQKAPECIDKTFSDSRFAKLKRVLVILVGPSDNTAEGAYLLKEKMPLLAKKGLLVINDKGFLV